MYKMLHHSQATFLHQLNRQTLEFSVSETISSTALIWFQSGLFSTGLNKYLIIEWFQFLLVCITLLSIYSLNHYKFVLAVIRDLSFCWNK